MATPEVIEDPRGALGCGAHLRGRYGEFVLAQELPADGPSRRFLARVESPSLAVEVGELRLPLGAERWGRARRESFLRAVELLRSLRSPGLGCVLDGGVHDGSPFIVSQHVLGQTLEQALTAAMRPETRPSRHRLPGLMMRCLAAAAEAVHSLHELSQRGPGWGGATLHGHLSPRAITLTFSGQVVVTGLGVPRCDGHFPAMDLAYAPPELLRGEPLDRRADIWSLGVVLWESLTQEPLFRAQGSHATAHAVLHAPIPDPGDLRPGVPSGVTPILRRALHRTAAARHTSAHELAADLRRVVRRREGLADRCDFVSWLEELMPHALDEQLARVDMAQRRTRPRLRSGRDPARASGVRSAHQPHDPVAHAPAERA